MEPDRKRSRDERREREWEGDSTANKFLQQTYHFSVTTCSLNSPLRIFLVCYRHRHHYQHHRYPFQWLEEPPNGKPKNTLHSVDSLTPSFATTRNLWPNAIARFFWCSVVPKRNFAFISVQQTTESEQTHSHKTPSPHCANQPTEIIFKKQNCETVHVAVNQFRAWDVRY